jgi:hypothetical protein
MLDVIRRDEDRGHPQACVPQPRHGRIPRSRSRDRPRIRWERAYQLDGAFDRQHTISVECLTSVQASRFFFSRQMWRDEANSFDRWPPMRDPHDRVSVKIVLGCPPPPMALDAHGRVNENTIEIEQHCVALQLCHGRRVIMLAAERRAQKAGKVSLTG